MTFCNISQTVDKRDKYLAETPKTYAEYKNAKRAFRLRKQITKLTNHQIKMLAFVTTYTRVKIRIIEELKYNNG